MGGLQECGAQCLHHIKEQNSEVKVKRKHQWRSLMCKGLGLRDAHGCTPARAGVEGTLLSACMAAPDTGMAGDAIGVTAAGSVFLNHYKAASFAELK